MSALSESQLPLVSRRSSINLFHWALLVVTLIPYVALAAQFAGVSGATLTVVIIGFIATGHVPATAYLLTDPDIRNYIRKYQGRMIYFCVAIVLLNFIVFGLLAENVGGGAPVIVYFFMLYYTLWQTWHFAKQNLGVFSFSCICSKRKPGLKIERWAVLGGGIAGVIGVYQAAGEGLKVYYPSENLSYMDFLFSQLWYLGLFILVLSIFLAVYSLWIRRKELKPVNVLLLLSSTAFFTPYFFTGDALLAFASFTWAHGLQYILILWVHSVSRRDVEGVSSAGFKWRWAYVAGAALFFMLCSLFVRDLIVWSTQFGTATAALLNIQANYPLILNLVVATLTSITMIHFIWDARLWRLSEHEPRAWVRKQFGFLFE
ncbi:hypothetical protein [Spongorhabdus nitratireducens]